MKEMWVLGILQKAQLVKNAISQFCPFFDKKPVKEAEIAADFEELPDGHFSKWPLS